MRLIFIFCFLTAIFGSFAQAPQGIYYQAVARDSAGNLVQNKPVSFRFTIRDVTPTGPVLYQQVDTVITDQTGLITIVLGGGGSIVQGNFHTINWAVAAKFLQVELDALGGTNYTTMGTTQMLSVPYALYAGSAPNSDTTWIHNATGDIYNSNTGNVGIHNASPQAALDVLGYTKLGENSPKIKMTTIRGLTPSLLGGSTTINLNIPDSNVVSVTVQVEDPVNGLIPPVSLLGGSEYNYSVLSSVFKLTLSLTNALSITNKPFHALIIYQEP